MRSDTGGATVTGTIDRTDAEAMTIDADGMAHIMGVLTNLYSDKNLAVLREYSTNALDSHVAAGVTRPIEVTLPSPLNPTLVIRDYGVGLSRDEIVQVYSRYGASTKRDTNTQVGAFGLGCKSAFTITDQFVVTGVKDGRKTVALFAVNEQGVGTVNVLSDTESSEPNGVLVSIGVPDPSGLARSAESFFASWQPGTVLVDGAAPESVYADALCLADGLHIANRDALTSGLVLVMGPVGYPVSGALLRQINESDTDDNVRKVAGGLLRGSAHVLLADTPMGSVDITPSREALRDTPRTVATVTDVLHRVAEVLPGLPQREAESAATATDAALRADRAKRHVSWLATTVGLPKITWHGEELTEYASVPMRGFRLVLRKGRRVCYGTDADLRIYPSDINHVTVVTGTPAGKSMRLKARKFLLSQTDACCMVLFADQPNGRLGWFSWGDGGPVKTITVEDFLAEAGTYVPEAPAREQTRYAIRLPDGTVQRLLAGEIADLDCPVFFLRASDHRSSFTRGATAEAAVIELIAQQSVKCLIERIPGVQDAAAAARTAATDFLDSVPDTDKLLIEAMHRADRDSHEATHIRSFLSDRMDEISPTSALRVWLDGVRRDLAAVGGDRDRLTKLSNRIDAARLALSCQQQKADSSDSYVLAHLPLLAMSAHDYRFRRGEHSEVAWRHLISYINSVPANRR